MDNQWWQFSAKRLRRTSLWVKQMFEIRYTKPAGPFKGPVFRTFIPASSLRRAQSRVPERASNCAARAREAPPCHLYITAGALLISEARTCILWLAIAKLQNYQHALKPMPPRPRCPRRLPAGPHSREGARGRRVAGAPGLRCKEASCTCMCSTCSECMSSSTFFFSVHVLLCLGT